MLETALPGSPLQHDYPVTTWTVVDRTDLLGRHGWSVPPLTVYRALPAIDSRDWRPRPVFRHRQDAEAVTLAELQTRGRLPELDSALSTWMNATSIPTPTWQRSGRTEDAR